MSYLKLKFVKIGNSSVLDNLELKSGKLFSGQNNSRQNISRQNNIYGSFTLAKFVGKTASSSDTRP
jgi:hypothetical protein